MFYVIAKIVSLMQSVFVAWNLYFWNYHCNLARMHDARLCELDQTWREKI